MSISVLKDRKRKYQVRVRDRQGKYYPTRCFRTMDEAKRHCRELEQRRDEGTVAYATRDRLVSLSCVAQIWFQRRLDAKRVSHGWVGAQQQMFKDHVEPVIGSVAIGDVSQWHVGEVLISMANAGKSAQLSLHVFNILHKLFKDVMKMPRFSYVKSNPAVTEDRPQVIVQERPFLHPVDSLTYVSSLENNFAQVPVALQLFAGVRSAEAIPLRVRNVDFEKDEIFISHSYRRREKVITKLKNGVQYRVAMPPPLREILLTHLKGRGPDEFVCQGPRGGMLSYNTYYKAVKRGASIGTQGLRHSSTELYVDQGATETDIQRLLNHKTQSCTRRYMHRTNDRQRALAAKVGKLSELIASAKVPLEHK